MSFTLILLFHTDSSVTSQRIPGFSHREAAESEASLIRKRYETRTTVRVEYHVVQVS